MTLESVTIYPLSVLASIEKIQSELIYLDSYRERKRKWEHHVKMNEQNPIYHEVRALS